MTSYRLPAAAKLARYLLSGLLLLALISHFIILAFSMLPANPISHQYKYQLFRYINPFFSQTWTLFSPNPISSNQRLLFKYDIYKNGVKQSTPWVDVVEPLTNTKKSNYWSPVQRILKHISASTNETCETRGKAIKFVAEHDSLKNDPVKAEKFLQKVINSSSGHKAIIEYSYYTYKQLKADGKVIHRPDSVNVTYLISNQEFPRFSKRKQDYFDLKNSRFTHLVSSVCPLQVRRI